MVRRPTDSDLDHAEWLNGSELTVEEMTAELHRVIGPVLDRIRNIEHSAHRCPHGINIEKATCGRCTPIGVEP